MRFAYLTFIFVAAMVAGLYAGPGAAGTAEAHTAPSGSFYTLAIREDRFKNWDFRSKSAVASNVDWPVTMLYYNNANINKVKNKLDAIDRIGRCGSGKKARLRDSTVTGYVWDNDGGIKDNCGTDWGQTRHMRVYADGNDKLYNLSWKYYIIGTTHVDHCHRHGFWPAYWCHHHYVGFSENANDWWDYYSDRVSGWTVFADWSSFSNSANFNDLHGSGEDHLVRSNGRATAVHVP